MLPGGRTEGEVFAMPQFSLMQANVEGFLHELRGFHETRLWPIRLLIEGQ
jgi:hypothetical protein